MVVKARPQTHLLGRAQAVACSVSVGDTPWSIGIDTLVLSCDADGYGGLGESLARAIPNLQLPGHDVLAGLTVAAPRVLELDPTTLKPTAGTKGAPEPPPWSELRRLVLVAVRDEDRAPTVEGVMTAAVSAIAAAANAGAGRVGLSLLGTGVLGLKVDDIAAAMVPAVRATLEALPSSSLAEVVFVAKDTSTATAIEGAWRAPPVDTTVRLEMIKDAPITAASADLLGYAPYAHALAFVIDHPETGTPLTIAINAPWGAGKTSLANLIEERLPEISVRPDPPIFCEFNAWQHDDSPHIVTALAAAVARAADKERSWWRRVIDPLPSGLLGPRARRHRKFVTTGVSVVVAGFALFKTGTFTDATAGGVTLSAIAAAIPASLSMLAQVRGTASDVGQMVTSPDAALTTGSVKDIRDDIGNLVKQATQRSSLNKRPGYERRMVVFIDDLERCQPARSIELCEAVSNLLDHPDIVTILIGDMQTLATAAEIKYKELAPRYRTRAVQETQADASAGIPVGSFGELYLEKIIQFRFDLPTHDATDLQLLAKKLIAAHDAVVQPDPDSDTPGPTDSDPSVVNAFQRTAGAVARWVAAPVRHWRARAARRRNAKRIVRLRATPAGAEDVFLSDGDLSDAERERMTAIVDSLRSLRRVESDYLDKSYDAVAQLVRPLPRDVKRLLNRLRFALKLYDDKALLKPAGPISVAAVGKWALLSERWPDLQAAISDDPGALNTLESSSATQSDFSTAMKGIVPGYANSLDLYRLVQSEPPLALVARPLARLRV